MRTKQEQVEAGLVTAIILLFAVAFFLGALCVQIANNPRHPAKPVPTGYIEL
jgi:hypothetical protein